MEKMSDQARLKQDQPVGMKWAASVQALNKRMIFNQIGDFEHDQRNKGSFLENPYLPEHNHLRKAVSSSLEP